MFLKSDARYVGMLVRGAGETFNLIVPVRRMQAWCEKNNILWALDPKVPLPDEAELKKIPVEDVGGSFAATKDEKRAKILEQIQKEYPFLLKTKEINIKQ